MKRSTAKKSDEKINQKSKQHKTVASNWIPYHQTNGEKKLQLTANIKTLNRTLLKENFTSKQDQALNVLWVTFSFKFFEEPLVECYFTQLKSEIPSGQLKVYKRYLAEMIFIWVILIIQKQKPEREQRKELWHAEAFCFDPFRQNILIFYFEMFWVVH